MSENKVDVAIIGAGPVGLYAGFYCGLRQLKTVIFDSLDHAGGQLYNLYPEKVVYDLPGYEKITAGEFVGKLEAQLLNHRDYVECRFGVMIESIQKMDDTTYRLTSKDQVIEAQAVILAMGNGSFVPRRLELYNEAAFTNIQYYVHTLEAYRGKNVVVFGGGDSAIDWSLMLKTVAASVTLVHRRREFRAKPANVELLKQADIKIMVPYVPVELMGSDGEVETVLLTHSEDNRVVEVACDEILVNYGTVSANQLIDDWGLKLERNKVLINQRSQTNFPGVFACGDVCTYEGREIQIIAGLTEGMMASASAYQYLNPQAHRRPVR